MEIKHEGSTGGKLRALIGTLELFLMPESNWIWTILHRSPEIRSQAFA